jgi:hypothetical protein
MNEIDKAALQNEQDFLDARMQVLRGKPGHSIRLIAKRKGIELPSEHTDDYELARMLAEAEAEKIGLMPADRGPVLAEEPGPLVREQYGAFDAEFGSDDLSEQEAILLNGQSYPAADVTGVPFDLDIDKAVEIAKSMAIDGETAAALECPYEITTSSGYFIWEVILPELLEHFFAKNSDYGDHHRESEFGIPGEYIGLHRKITKLKAALWDGQVMNGEDAKEMLYDLVGQSLIILDLIAAEESARP